MLMFLIRFFGWAGVGDEFLAWNRFNGILLAVAPVVNCGGNEPGGIGLSQQSRIDLFVCGVFVAHHRRRCGLLAKSQIELIRRSCLWLLEMRH